jgi:hypothetical protein
MLQGGIPAEDQGAPLPLTPPQNALTPQAAWKTRTLLR